MSAPGDEIDIFMSDSEVDGLFEEDGEEENGSWKLHEH